jgi:Fe-S-cluster containining protein
MVAKQETLCARCALQGRTCCQGREIYITPGDVRRIVAAMGEMQFFEWTRTIDPSYGDQDDDPLWQAHVFRSDGSRRILMRQPNGDCVFLDRHGCRLPVEVRPLLCRLHPFTYTADHIDAEPDAGCPRFLLAPGESVFEATQTSVDLAQRWHHQLYEEIMTDENDKRYDLSASR